MPPTAAQKGKGKRKRDDEAVPPFATLLARLSRAQLETLLLGVEGAVPTLRDQVLELLQPEEVRR